MLLLAAMPFGLEIGVTVSSLGSVGLLLIAYLSSPVIEVSQSIRVGRFNVPLNVMGEISELSKESLREHLESNLTLEREC